MLGAKANCWGNNDETHGHDTLMIHNHSCLREDYSMVNNNHHGNCHHDNPIDQLVCNPKGHYIYHCVTLMVYMVKVLILMWDKLVIRLFLVMGC